MTTSSKLTLLIWLILATGFYGLLWLQQSKSWQEEAQDHFHKLVDSIRAK